MFISRNGPNVMQTLGSKASAGIILEIYLFIYIYLAYSWRVKSLWATWGRGGGGGEGVGILEVEDFSAEVLARVSRARSELWYFSGQVPVRVSRAKSVFVISQQRCLSMGFHFPEQGQHLVISMQWFLPRVSRARSTFGNFSAVVPAQGFQRKVNILRQSEVSPTDPGGRFCVFVLLAVCFIKETLKELGGGIGYKFQSSCGAFFWGWFRIRNKTFPEPTLQASFSLENHAPSGMKLLRTENCFNSYCF